MEESVDIRVKRCPVCGRPFSYASNPNYEPKTCGDYECQHKYLHPDLKGERR